MKISLPEQNSFPTARLWAWVVQAEEALTLGHLSLPEPKDKGKLKNRGREKKGNGKEEEKREKEEGGKE